MKPWLLTLIGLILSCSLHGEPLPSKEAFPVAIKEIHPNSFTLNWTTQPGYYLYSNRIHVIPAPNSNVTLGTLRLPPSVTKTDKKGTLYHIYRNELTVPVDVLGIHPGESLLYLSYQGCSDEGFCYPVETKQIKLTIDTQLALSKALIEAVDEMPSLATQPKEDAMAQIFSQHNGFMVLLVFYGLGLLLAFTPCILPMVPVLSGIIVGHGKDITTPKAFFLSLSYVLSMSLTYAAVGAVIALVGANLQINMQNPWAIVFFSALFIALALSMFGFYEFKLPSHWQEKIAGSNNDKRKGHYLGAALMGCLSTLILSPCVTAPLIGILTYIAQSHDVLLGCLALFCLSLGMGTPLLIIGTSAGKLLPKAGSWMNAVKAFFGIVLLGVALFLLSRILPPALTMFFWACLFIFSGIFVGAFTQASNHKELFHKSIGLILFVYGLLILIGTSMGAHDPLQPLGMLNKSSAAAPTSVRNNQYSLASLKKEISEAKGQPVLLDFYADWCTSCTVMENTVFSNPLIEKELAHWVVIKVDLTQNTAQNKQIMRHFNVIAPPTYLFFSQDGLARPSLTTAGELSASEFSALLQKTESFK